MTQRDTTIPEAALPASAAATPASASAPESEPTRGGLDGFVQGLVTELREAGELGKKQWEDVLGRIREHVAKGPEAGRAELERQASEIRGRVVAALEDEENVAGRTRAAAARARAQLDASFARAQERGADILLGVVARVRRSAEELERSLARFRGDEEPTEPRPQAA